MEREFQFDCLECGATWQSDIEDDWACRRCDERDLDNCENDANDDEALP